MKEKPAAQSDRPLTPFDATGVILAGGKSSRMGRDKSVLLLSDGKLTMTEAVWRKLAPLCREMLIVGNCRDKFGLPDTREIFDYYQGRGPLGGIQAGLKESAWDYAFIASCDLAFFNPELAAYLLSRSRGYQLVIPRHGGRYEPLFAVYHKSALAAVEDQLDQGERRLAALVPRLKTLIVEERELADFAPPEELFFNVNTEQDYHKLGQLKRGKE